MYLTIKRFHGRCPTCESALEECAVTAVNTANTAPALQMLRGVGHLVVLAGTSWLLRCAKDAQNRLQLVHGLAPADAGSPVASASAATQPQGARRR